MTTSTSYNQLKPLSTTHDHSHQLMTAHNHSRPLTATQDHTRPLTITYNHLRPLATTYNYWQPVTTISLQKNVDPWKFSGHYVCLASRKCSGHYVYLARTVLRPIHPGWELIIQFVSFTFDHPVYYLLLITLYLARLTTTTTHWVTVSREKED